MNGLLKKEENGILPYAEEFLKQTRLDLDDAKMSFFKIGFRLNEAMYGRYFTALGYDDIYALAQNEFGFEKTTTKNLMSINREYSERRPAGLDFKPYSMYIAEKYKKYSQTQLVEMLPLTNSAREYIPEDFTISELRDYKKLCNSSQRERGCLNEYTSYHNIIKSPREAVKKYREEKAEIERAKEFEKTTDVLAGQLYFTDTGEMTEYHQSDGEEFHDAEVSRLTEEPESGELGEVLEECAAIDKEQSAADVMEGLREKYLLSSEEFASAGKAFEIPTFTKRTPRHIFKNKTERETFIRDIKNFPVVVLHCEELQLTVRRCDFANGAKLYRTEYKEFLDWNKKTVDKSCLCLIDIQPKAEGTGNNSGGTFSPKTYTLYGTAPTYVIDYMTKFKDEI